MYESSSTSFNVHHNYCNMEKSLDTSLSEESVNTNDCPITVSPPHGGGGWLSKLGLCKTKVILKNDTCETNSSLIVFSVCV